MAKSKQRKKPGYTKSGEVKIVSLNIAQLVPLLTSGRKKVQGKVKARLAKLGYVAPVAVETAEAAE